MDSDLVQWIRKNNEKVQQERAMEWKSPAWKQEPWYHGQMDRPSTESILMGRRPGLFLVRDSSTCPGDYVLSVSENSKVSHYIISRRGGLYLIGDQSFTEFPNVIEFYKKHFLDTTTLTEPAPPRLTNPLMNPPLSQPTATLGEPIDHHLGGGIPPTLEQALPPPIPVIGKLTVKGKFDFNTADSEDLSFKKGDLMEVLRKDEEDWWFAKHSDGRTGSVPVPYLQIVEEVSRPFLAKAIKDRECPYDPTALCFKAGEIIKVTKQNENGMWEGDLNGKSGHFPFTLVEVIEDSQQ